MGNGLEILTVADMAPADEAAIAAGTPGLALMERAGAAVADAVCDRWSPRRTERLCFRRASERLRDEDSNLDYLIQSQASYH